MALRFLQTQVNATERDSGAGADIRYRIAAGGANRFEINEVNGLIQTSDILDREDVNRYILTVEARDMGGVPLTSFVQVCSVKRVFCVVGLSGIYSGGISILLG